MQKCQITAGYKTDVLCHDNIVLIRHSLLQGDIGLCKRAARSAYLPGASRVTETRGEGAAAARRA